MSSDYYPALQRVDVDLVTDSIERITPTGIRTRDGTERPADTIIFCTGFRGIGVPLRNGGDRTGGQEHS